MTDPSNAQNLQAQNALAQNENPMSSTLTTPTPQDFDTQLSAEDQALLFQLTSGLEQRSAAAPNVASEAVLRKIASSSSAVDKNRRRKLAGFTVAVATLAGTPFVVRPAITAFRGEEKPVVVSTSTSAMPKFIVGAFEKNQKRQGTVFSGSLGMDRVRLRKGETLIDLFAPGGINDSKGPNGELPITTQVMIGSLEGKKIQRPWNGVNAVEYYWLTSEGSLQASAKGIPEIELLAILGSARRTPFVGGSPTRITVDLKPGYTVLRSSSQEWSYFGSVGPSDTPKYDFSVMPVSEIDEDDFGHAKTFVSPGGRTYDADLSPLSRRYVSWIDQAGARLYLSTTYNDPSSQKPAPLSDSEWAELVAVADSVKQVDDETFAKYFSSGPFFGGSSGSKVPKKVPAANVLDGTVDGVAWKLTSGETPEKTEEKPCSKITFSGPAKPFTDCVPENSKEEFVSLGAARVGATSPKTVVFGVVKDTLEIIRVRNSEGTMVGEDFSIENGYLDGRAFAIELPTNVTGELTVEAYSYDDDVADNLPEGQFLPDDAKPLATKTLNVK
jgi:hypothetical protein